MGNRGIVQKSSTVAKRAGELTPSILTCKLRSSSTSLKVAADREDQLASRRASSNVLGTRAFGPVDLLGVSFRNLT